MNNKKPDSLYQSMEKWIELYRDINTCSSDQAHDAFEEWAEKLRGESSDQTTTQFHEAVKASCEEMSPEPKAAVAIKRRAVLSTREEFVFRNVITSDPIQNLVGGPILETGVDPLAFKSLERESVVITNDCRAKAEECVRVQTDYLVGTKFGWDHPTVVKAKVLIAAAKSRLQMLDGVEERAKERKGILKLKRP